MKIFHSHRNSSNWLAYKLNQKFFDKFSANFGRTIYDFGCGEMPYRDYLLQFSENYVGVDWNNSLHSVKADIVADLNKVLPIDSNIADTVISISVLEHLCEPQVMLDEAFRILKPDGTIILQVPWQWWLHEEPHDYFRYSPYGLKFLFSRAGFRDIQIYPSSGFFTMLFMKVIYFSARSIRGPQFLRFALRSVLVPFWLSLQLLAPMFDKLDQNWGLETASYWVLAKK